MILSLLLFAFLNLSQAADSSSAAAEVESLLTAQSENVFQLGKTHYQKYCIACHATANIMVASPKFADKNDWNARLVAVKNIKGLVKSAVKGKGAMPAKGLCSECKEKDLQAAILYMMRGLD